MAERRALSYCAVRSLAGKEVADEMFARHLPPGFDLDAPGDMALVESDSATVTAAQVSSMARAGRKKERGRSAGWPR